MNAQTTLKGIPTSRGVAVGTARLMLSVPQQSVPQTLKTSDLNAECKRLRRAFAAASSELKRTRKRLPAELPAEVGEVIDTHILLLEDAEFVDGSEALIRTRKVNAEWALKLKQDELQAVFSAMQEAYLQQRFEDVRQVISRVQRQLAGVRSETLSGSRLRGAIIVAQEISPSELSDFALKKVAAVVTASGGPLSHSAILARSLKIPAVMGLGAQAIQAISEGVNLAVDGSLGEVHVRPRLTLRAEFMARRLKASGRARAFSQTRRLPSESKDGVPITLLANVEIGPEIAQSLAAGAVGIGLYRSEFLFVGRASAPTEDEQFAAYKAVLSELKGQPVVIRTLDLGSDKNFVPGLPIALNPALGLRAVRLCLRHPALFRVQLRALKRASVFGNLRILVPMLSALEEIRAVKRLIASVEEELDREGIEFVRDIPLGGMIEIPAAAIAARHFARELDFMSIGTNDLIQYTLAIDRGDDQVAHLYNPLHPAILKLIKRVIDAGLRAGKAVTLCGEMAADPKLTRVLLGLGLREFSMSPAALLEVKHAVRSARIDRAEVWVRKMLVSRDPKRYLTQINRGAKFVA